MSCSDLCADIVIHGAAERFRRPFGIALLRKLFEKHLQSAGPQRQSNRHCRIRSPGNRSSRQLLDNADAGTAAMVASARARASIVLVISSPYPHCVRTPRVYAVPRQTCGTRNIHAMESQLAPYCGGCLKIAGMRAAFTHGAIPIGADRGDADLRLGDKRDEMIRFVRQEIAHL
jgi:hypothetical protein